MTGFVHFTVDILSILNCGQLNENWIDLAGQPLLAFALAAGHGSAVLSLYNRGVDVNSGLASPAIHHAISNGQLNCVRLLLGDEGAVKTQATELNIANPRLRDCYGRTPMRMALSMWKAALKSGKSDEIYRNIVKFVHRVESSELRHKILTV